MGCVEEESSLSLLLKTSVVVEEAGSGKGTCAVEETHSVKDNREHSYNPTSACSAPLTCCRLRPREFWEVKDPVAVVRCRCRAIWLLRVVSCLLPVQQHPYRRITCSSADSGVSESTYVSFSSSNEGIPNTEISSNKFPSPSNLQRKTNSSFTVSRWPNHISGDINFIFGVFGIGHGVGGRWDWEEEVKEHMSVSFWGFNKTVIELLNLMLLQDRQERAVPSGINI